MENIYKVYAGVVETQELISEALQSYKTKSKSGYVGRAWKEKQYTGSFGYSIYVCERSFKDKAKAIEYAKIQLTTHNEYHQKRINITKIKLSDLALLK